MLARECVTKFSVIGNLVTCRCGARHTLPPCSASSPARSPTAARRLLDELRTPHLQIIIDPANVDLDADALREAFDLLGDDLVLAHAKDRRLDGTVVAAGQGDVDYDLYLELLRGCDVPLILHGLGEHEVPGAVAFLRRPAA